MPRRIISLNDANWRFGSVSQKPFRDTNDLEQVREWLPAQVPGDVRLDLLRAKKISDPFYAMNNEDSQWVDAFDWWYVRDVELELEPGERAFLIFEGIDYQSAVFFNGQQLGRHVGMFSRQVYEIEMKDNRRQTSESSHSPLVTRPSSLAIRVWGSDALPKMRLSPGQKIWKRIIAPLFAKPNQPFPDRYATLKCQMQFGWDFAPRLRTCGIWDEAYVIVTRSVVIEDAWINPVSNLRSHITRVQVILALDSDREQKVRAQIGVHGKNFSSDAQTFAFDLELARGKQTREIAFDVQDAHLWNPWDRGDPNLYEMEIEIIAKESDASARRGLKFEVDSARLRADAPNASLDSFVTTLGIRSFRLAHTPGAPRRAEPWTFVINGHREFIRGANWVPLDAIPARLSRDDYAARLQQAREANINFLRVWGGGLKEKRAFYDLCDELGLLVWQEFPFAGAILDRFPKNRGFLNLVSEECSAIVRALRHHPSLVIWCGGNEFNTRGNRALVRRLKALVADEDGTRPFKPASPYRDESHNWRVWHRYANLRDYRKEPSPFLSEFGLQSMPNMASLKKFLPDDAWSAPNALWEYHHAELKKLARYADRINPEIDSVEKFVDAAQRAQAIGLQIAIEYMRRRKPKTSDAASARSLLDSDSTKTPSRADAAGVAVWQFNDTWPAISWSVVDYYGQPKRAYEELKRLYAPVFASFDYALQSRRVGDIVRGHLWLINDLREEFAEVELRACLNDQEIYARRISLPPDSCARIDALDVPLGDGQNILRLIVHDADRTLSDHAYDLNFCDVGEMSPLAALWVSMANRWMR